MQRRSANLKLVSNYGYDYDIPNIVVTDEQIEPKIKIYDHNGDYWFSKIGFNRKITDEF